MTATLEVQYEANVIGDGSPATTLRFTPLGDSVAIAVCSYPFWFSSHYPNSFFAEQTYEWNGFLDEVTLFKLAQLYWKAFQDNERLKQAKNADQKESL